MPCLLHARQSDVQIEYDELRPPNMAAISRRGRVHAIAYQARRLLPTLPSHRPLLYPLSSTLTTQHVIATNQLVGRGLSPPSTHLLPGHPGGYPVTGYHCPQRKSVIHRTWLSLAGNLLTLRRNPRMVNAWAASRTCIVSSVQQQTTTVV